jgi:bifunctional non-homologous end joining protein LigD
VLDGEMTLKTRKGLDWTAKYPAIAKAAGSLPDAIIDGEICALDENGAPDFAALQAALSEGKTDLLVYFAFDLLFEGGEDLGTRPIPDRKERLQQLCGCRRRRPSSLRRAFRDRWRGGAALGLPVVP